MVRLGESRIGTQQDPADVGVFDEQRVRLMDDEGHRLRPLHDKVARRGVGHITDFGNRRLDGFAGGCETYGSPLTYRLIVPRETPATTATSCTVARFGRPDVVDTPQLYRPAHLTAGDAGATLCTFTEAQRRSSSPKTVHVHILASVDVRSPVNRPLATTQQSVDRPRYEHLGIDFGCDYNHEQWDPGVWREDIALMRDVGVTLVAVNIFGWSELQSPDGTVDFSRLDEVIGLLHGAGIRVNLGTGTASPPPWLTTRHPEILPVVADGTTRYPGGRQAWCPSSPVFREYALTLVQAVAERYGSIPLSSSGTSPTSSAATTPTATATSARARSAAGCRSVTERSQR